MCSPNIAQWCLVLLLVVSSSKSQKNSTNDERNDNSMIRHDSLGHIRKNGEQSNQKMSMEFHANSTETNDFTLHEINENLTTTKAESNSMSNEIYGNFNSNNSTIIACGNVTCIQLCCPLGEKITTDGTCIPGQDNYSFPRVFGNEARTLNELFPLTVRDPCVHELGRNILTPNEYLFYVNGSLYQGPGKFVLPTKYCLAIFKRPVYDVIVCTYQLRIHPTYMSSCLLVSLPCFLVTFIVYSILPEHRNLHGYTLRAYIASLFIMYAITYPIHEVYGLIKWKYCVPLAYIYNFSVLSSFFWLNVICFDIWWTFRHISNKISLKQDKKRFVKYSLYALGIPFIHSVFCAIMDYAPEIPESWIRPKMCKSKFWMGYNAIGVYIYIPMGTIIISNICFFIATTLTILNQKKVTADQMSHSESKRHNENKQRFSMYLKLFILMGITWIMELIADLSDITVVPPIIWIPTNMINVLQGVIIFIIFVCTKKNKQLLLKRLGGWNCGTFCKIPISDNSMANTTSTS